MFPCFNPAPSVNHPDLSSDSALKAALCRTCPCVAMRTTHTGISIKTQSERVEHYPVGQSAIGATLSRIEIFKAAQAMQTRHRGAC
jgi:hypothetical protein